MKFALAFVAALTQAADLQQYDGIDITIWDDGTFTVHDGYEPQGIDLTIWDDGTFEVHEDWEEDWEDDWEDDWENDWEDDNYYCGIWTWEECSQMEYRSVCEWDGMDEDTCGWFYWNDYSYTEFFVSCEEFESWSECNGEMEAELLPDPCEEWTLEECSNMWLRPACWWELESNECGTWTRYAMEDGDEYDYFLPCDDWYSWCPCEEGYDFC